MKKMIFTVSAFSVLVGVFYYLVFLDKAKFDREKWTNAVIAESDSATDVKLAKCLRGGMLEDLARKYFKKNITKQQHLSLLGKPQKSMRYGKCRNGLMYLMGYCKRLKFDIDSLVICYDKNNRYSNYYWLYG